MPEHDLKASDLDQFTGSQQWFRHGLARKVLYTEGAKHVAEHGGAYWLLDEIALSQIEPKLQREEFQVWTLRRDPDAGASSATITVEDGNHHTLLTKKIPFTDFPLPEITLWFTDNVILLPREY